MNHRLCPRGGGLFSNVNIQLAVDVGGVLSSTVDGSHEAEREESAPAICNSECTRPGRVYTRSSGHVSVDTDVAVIDGEEDD